MAEKKQKRAVGYIRVSTAEQIEGESLHTQTKEIEQFAEYHKFDLIEVYEDKGLSGAKIEHRKALQKMIKDAKRGKFAVLIFYKFSRLARNVREFQNIIFELKEYGVEVQCVKENIDQNTQTGKLLMNVLSAFAEWEHETIKEQTSVNRLSKWKDKRAFIGKPTYGYKVVNKNELVIEPKEKKVFLEIVDMYTKKGMSHADIVLNLNSRGIKSKQGKKWNSPTLGRMLSNPAYYGKLIVNKYVYEDGPRGAGTVRTKKLKPESEWIYYEIEPLISKKQWDRIQEIKNHRKLKSKRINEATHNYFLRDILYCKRCGGRIKPVTGNTKKDGTTYRYYSCYWSRKNKKSLEMSGHEKCTLPYIPAQELEQHVLWKLTLPFVGDPDKTVSEMFNDSNFDKEIIDQTEAIKSLKKDIRTEENKRMNLMELLKEPDLNKSDFKAEFMKCSEELTTLNSYLLDAEIKLAEIENKRKQVEEGIQFFTENKGTLMQLYSDIKELEPDDKKKLVESLIDEKKIYVDYDYFHFDDEELHDTLVPGILYKGLLNSAVLQQLIEDEKLSPLTKNHPDNGCTH